MTIAILCSGQGQQGAEMFALSADGADGVGRRADGSVAALFAHASHAFGADPREWVRRAASDELHANGFAQRLCTLHALAAYARLAPRLPKQVLKNFPT